MIIQLGENSDSNIFQLHNSQYFKGDDEHSCTISSEFISKFLDDLSRVTQKICLYKQNSTFDHELELARFNLCLSIFEGIRRSGGLGWPPSFLEDGVMPENFDDIMNAIPDSWVEDTARLAVAFMDRHKEWQGKPAILNPELSGVEDVGGADGDLILSRCLWEIKTTIKTKAYGWWLYQLLGYVLLDYEDDYCIDRVGFLFPRQNTSISWSLSDFVNQLSGGSRDLSIQDLRAEFRDRL